MTNLAAQGPAPLDRRIMSGPLGGWLPALSEACTRHKVGLLPGSLLAYEWTG